MFKIRIENGEFWAIESGGLTEEKEFKKLSDAVAAAQEFLDEADEDGLDYEADEIEIVELKGSRVISVRTLEEIHGSTPENGMSP